MQQLFWYNKVHHITQELCVADPHTPIFTYPFIMSFLGLEGRSMKVHVRIYTTS